LSYCPFLYNMKNMTKCIKENLNLPWDWNGLSRDPNITFEFINR